MTSKHSLRKAFITALYVCAMWSHAGVFLSVDKSCGFMWMCACFCQNMSEQACKCSKFGWKSGVKVSSMAYVATSLSWCHTSDVKEGCPLSWTTHNLSGSSLWQVETNSMTKDFSAKPLWKKETLPPSSGCSRKKCVLRFYQPGQNTQQKFTDHRWNV